MISPKKISTSLLKDLNLENLPTEKKQQSLKKIENHFNQVILATLLSYLNQEQYEDLKAALVTENFEEKIINLAAEVPSLDKILQERINKEYELLKMTMS